MGTVPMVYWAYNTGGTVTTSPVFSGDGTQIAFVQTDGAGHGNLVLVRWAPSASETIGNPMTLTRLANTSYPGCTAPCMTSTVLTDSSMTPHGDTNSSVFYDYGDDIAFVGDNGGWLHKISPVFNGVPAEVRSAGWPVQVNPGAPTALTSPVYDGTSGRAFVADVGGFLYRVGSGTAFVAVSSGPLDVSSAEGGAGIVQGPIVDSTAELVYVFASADGSAHCVGGADCAAVYQLPVNFPSGDIGQKTVVGASTIFGKAIPSPLYIGAFDSAYENSVNATGNLYVCGNTGGPPIFYQVPITAAAFSASNPLTFLSNSTTPCSPVTHILNPNASSGPTEWIFASVQKSAVSNLPGCAASASGCIYNTKVTPWQPSTAYAVGQEVLDSHFQIQVVETAGTSKATVPAWSTTTGGTTSDNSVTWLNQGLLSTTIVKPAFATHTNYTVGTLVFDTNDNIELCTTAGRCRRPAHVDDHTGGYDDRAERRDLGELGPERNRRVGCGRRHERHYHRQHRGIGRDFSSLLLHSEQPALRDIGRRRMCDPGVAVDITVGRADQAALKGSTSGCGSSRLKVGCPK